MVLALMGHRGWMTCSAAAGSVASESIHQGQLTRKRRPWLAAQQELRPRAVNTMEVIVGHVSEVPVVRSSRRSATEIPPARHRPDLGKTRVSRSSRRRNASRGATSPTRSISEKSPTCRLSLRLNRVHSTGLALPDWLAATPRLSEDGALVVCFAPKGQPHISLGHSAATPQDRMR